MRMIIRIRNGLLAILLLGCSEMVNAGKGIKRSEWSFRPEITTDNVILGVVGMTGGMILEGAIYDEGESPWWFPLVTYRGNPGMYLKEDYTYHHRTTKSDYQHEGKLHYDDKMRIVDFNDIGYSIGGCLTYMSKEIPLGFWFKLSYERQVYKIKGATGVKGYMSQEGEWIYDKSSEVNYTSAIGNLIGDNATLSKQMIVPEAGLKIRFGKYRTAEQIFTIDLGARYDYALDSKGLYGGKDVVNNGITGIIGFAYGRPDKHFQVGFDYEHPFYDYFNRSYSPDRGRTYPFKDTYNGGFRFSMSIYVRRGF